MIHSRRKLHSCTYESERLEQQAHISLWNKGISNFLIEIYMLS